MNDTGMAIPIITASGDPTPWQLKMEDTKKIFLVNDTSILNQTI